MVDSNEYEEMSWDTETRWAVERELKDAKWNEEDRTIMFSDSVVDSYEALLEYLEEVADLAFNAHVSYEKDEEGNLIFKRKVGIVETALRDYEDKLAKFFDDTM